MKTLSAPSSLCLLLVALLSAGCATSFGRSFNILSSDNGMVKIEYDPVLVSKPAMQMAAEGICEKTGKDAVLVKTDEDEHGLDINSYKCE